MQIQLGRQRFISPSKALAVSIGLVVCLSMARSADAQLKSGIYDTSSGATAQEQGDNVAGGSRLVPLSATLTIDLAALQPSLTAVIHNAVLEGGSTFGSGVLGGRPQPFELTVRSLTGSLLTDGSYRFTGDYLRDLFPAGTQYLFDWRFSSTSDGRVQWNGQSYWAGGHIWTETLSNVNLVPEPSTLALDLRRRGVLWIDYGSQKLPKNRRVRVPLLAEYPSGAAVNVWDRQTGDDDTVGSRLALRRTTAYFVKHECQIWHSKTIVRMQITKPNRATHTYRQRLHAAPAKVFPLLCPVRETEWADGWSPELVVSTSGVAERDCVFLTPDEQGTVIWYITRHEPENWFVEMLKILPGVTACRLQIQLSENGDECLADVTYSHTSLGPAGNEFVAKFTAEYYLQFMHAWEKALNHFLKTGCRLADESTA